MKLSKDLKRESGRGTRQLYEFPQPNAPMLVREYLFTTLEGNRCCLLRWFMRDDIPVDSMTYVLVQLDARGDEVDTVELTHTALELPHIVGGQLFTPLWAIPVEPSCVSVRVYLKTVVSGAYVYHITPQDVRIDYEPPEENWTYNRKWERRDRVSDKKPLRVTSKRKGRMGGLGISAFLIVLLLCLVICFPYLKAMGIPQAILNFVSGIFQNLFRRG